MRQARLGLMLMLFGAVMLVAASFFIVRSWGQAESARPGVLPGNPTPREKYASRNRTQASRNRTRKVASSPRYNASSASENRCIKFFTVATEVNRRMCKYLRTAAVAGIDPHILGVGRDYPGHHVKLQFMVQELASVPPDCVVVFTDGFDVLFSKTPPQEILARYRQMMRKSGRDQLIFSTECNCLAFNRPCDDFPPSPPGFPARFPNSGGWISTAGLAINFWNAVLASMGNVTRANDQAYANEIFRKPELRERFSLGVDDRSRIFASLGTGGGPMGTGVYCRPIDEYKQGISFKDGVWKNVKQRAVSPAVMHFNGGSKLYMAEWFQVWRKWEIARKNRGEEGRVWLNRNQTTVAQICSQHM